MGKAQISYCGQVVRDYDPDRYLLSMLCPADTREALWALFAFNHEIAKTREVVSETQLGLIRLQWWRDRIGEIYDNGAVAEHEVLKPLAVAISAYDLPREHFDKLTYAREFDLEDVLPANIEGLINYADFTTTPLHELVLKVLGEGAGDPVQVVSVNYALAGVLRAVPHFASQRRCVLPEDVMQDAGQSVNKLYEYKRIDNFYKIVEEVAQHYVGGVKCESRFLRAVQKLSSIYMKQLEKSGFDPFSVRMQSEPAFKILRVMSA